MTTLQSDYAIAALYGKSQPAGPSTSKAIATAIVDPNDPLAPAEAVTSTLPPLSTIGPYIAPDRNLIENFTAGLRQSFYPQLRYFGRVGSELALSAESESQSAPAKGAGGTVGHFVGSAPRYINPAAGIAADAAEEADRRKRAGQNDLEAIAGGLFVAGADLITFKAASMFGPEVRDSVTRLLQDRNPVAAARLVLAAGKAAGAGAAGTEAGMATTELGDAVMGHQSVSQALENIIKNSPEAMGQGAALGLMSVAGGGERKAPKGLTTEELSVAHEALRAMQPNEPGMNPGKETFIKPAVLDAAAELRDLKGMTNAEETRTQIEEAGGETPRLGQGAQEQVHLRNPEQAQEAKADVTPNAKESTSATPAPVSEPTEPLGPLDQIIHSSQKRIEELRAQVAQARANAPEGARLGASPLLAELPYHIAIFSAKAIKLGVKGAASIRDFVETEISALGGEFAAALRPFSKTISLEVRRVMREGIGADGGVDSVRIYGALKDADTRMRRAQDQIAADAIRRARDLGQAADEEIGEAVANAETAKTGSKLKTNPSDIAVPGVAKKRREPKTITESEALNAVMRGQARAAKAGYRAGAQHVADTIPSIKKKMADDAKQDRLDIAGVKTRIRELVQKHIDPAVQGKFLIDVDKAVTETALNNALNKMRTVASEYRFNKAVRQANKTAKRSSGTNFTEARRDEIAKIKADIKATVYSGKTVTVTRKDGSTYERRLRNTFDSPEAFRKAADSLEAAHERISEIAAEQNHDQQMRISGKIMRREAVVQGAIPNIQASGKAIALPNGLPETARASLAGRTNQYFLNPDAIGTMTHDRNLHRLIADEFWDGETKVNRDAQHGDDALKANMAQAGYIWGSDRAQRLSAEVSHRDAQRVTVDFPDAGKIEATPAEWMSLYATLTDSGAGAKIEAGAPIVWARDKNATPIAISPSDATHLINTLDPNLKAVVDRAKAYIETNVRPGIFKAFREQKGYDLEQVENYWRTRRRREQKPETGLIESVRVTMNRALENLGFLKERLPDASSPFVIGDFFADYHEIVHNGAVVTHMTRRVRNAELVFQDPQLRRAIEQRFGEDMNKRLDTIIDAAKLVFHEPRTMLEKTAGFLNRNIARAKLTINVATYMKQVGGISKLYAEIDPKYVNAGIPNIYSAEVSDIIHNAAYFRDRYEGSIWRRFTPSLNRRSPLLGDSRIGDLAPRLLSRRALGATSELIDKITLLNTFDAIPVRAAIAAKIAEFDAKFGNAYSPEFRRRWVEREAEFAVRRTQNSPSPLDMSGIAYDLRGNPLASPLLMFSSDNNKSYNMVIRAHQRGAKASARTATAVAVNNAWAAGVNTLMRYVLPSGIAAAVIGGSTTDNKRRKTAGEAFAVEFVKNMSSTVYGLDKLAAIGESIYDAATGRIVNRDNIVRDNPVEGAVGNVMLGLYDIGRSIFASGTFESGPRKGDSKAQAAFLQGLEETAMGTLDLTGVPISPAYYQGKQAYRASRGAKKREPVY